ncbi:carotenoid oxygenase family protein [Sneathiella marina]|uniref:Dioxygenase n=1 Tax=Sneathiella marina TaxID=2950108 RepID=A0ABY4W441_9PROT|nr:carotenoid oxygenase family protein [Sneathiella marina]USG61956.1 carotenoid oxygenase family protein [Sneathiella marina]
MNRRDFLKTFAASLAMGTVSGISNVVAGESWKKEFSIALKEKPWLLGYEGISGHDFGVTALTQKGQLPDDLRGVLYRNGPAQHVVGDMRYHHWFDGDGLVNAFRFSEDGVTHQGRFVRTAKFQSEAKAGHAIEQGFGTALLSLRSPSNNDALNVANINVITHAGELLALWEGGSAYRLDPDTLETLGLKTWSADTKGLPFSAHPRKDANGTLWNFGYATSFGALIVYQIAADGTLKNVDLIKLPYSSMVHDFMITEKYLVFILPPFHYDTSRQGSFLDHFEWYPERGGVALVIDKNDSSKVQEIEIPAFWVFHFANAYDEPDGSIAFSCPIYRTPNIMTQGFRNVMRGREISSLGSRFMSARLHPGKRSFTYEEVPEAAASEFPRIDDRRQGVRARFSFLMKSSGELSHAGFDRICRLDQKAGALTFYQFGAQEQAEEHVFVANPRSDQEGQGWLVGTSLDYNRQRTSLNVFDAEKPENGPIARFEAAFPLPFGLHGNFVPTGS